MCYDVHEGGWACHERVAIRVRIYVPMSCRYIRARCARFGRLSCANEPSDSDRRHEPSLSTSTVHATAGRTAAAARCAVHRRRAPRAPPCRKALSVGKKWRELEFLTLRISQNCRYPQRFPNFFQIVKSFGVPALIPFSGTWTAWTAEAGTGGRRRGLGASRCVPMCAFCASAMEQAQSRWHQAQPGRVWPGQGLEGSECPIRPAALTRCQCASRPEFPLKTMTRAT